MYKCPACNSIYEEKTNFCAACGAGLAKSDDDLFAGHITKSIVFYLVFIAYIVIYYVIYLNTETSLTNEIILEGIFALIILVFCALEYKKILSLFKLPKLPWYIILLCLCFPIFSSIIVHISMAEVNLLLLDVETENLYLPYQEFSNSKIWAILFVAIVPGIFEELGFRGYLFSQLLNITSARVTILVTAFLFAIMHFSLISIVWIFPFGVLLGYLRNKYNTLLLGMFIHFLHNLLVLSYDILSYENDIDITSFL